MHSQQKAEAETSVNRDEINSPNDTIDHEIANDDDSDDEKHQWTGVESTQIGKSEGDYPSDHINKPHESDPETRRKIGPTTSKQLDLDDFANSPAADADDTADSNEDVEVRVTLG